MDYHHEATTLRPEPGRELTAWQDLGAGTRPTCSPPRSTARTKVPQAIHQMIGELKVRFQHTSGGDPEGFKARCGFLAEDLADAPPLLLRLAIAQWVRERPFLPTAADLTQLMREELERRDQAAQPATPRPGYSWAQSYCDQRNAAIPNNPDPHARKDIEWYVDSNGDPQMRILRPEPAPVFRVDPADVERLNRALRKYGAGFRYNRAGYDFDLTPGEPDPTDHERDAVP